MLAAAGILAAAACEIFLTPSIAEQAWKEKGRDS